MGRIIIKVKKGKRNSRTIIRPGRKGKGVNNIITGLKRKSLGNRKENGPGRGLIKKEVFILLLL